MEEELVTKPNPTARQVKRCEICRIPSEPCDLVGAGCCPNRNLLSVYLSECSRYTSFATSEPTTAPRASALAVSLARYLYNLSSNLYYLLKSRECGAEADCVIDARIRAMERISKLIQRDGNFIPFRSHIDSSLAIGYIACANYALQYGDGLVRLRMFLNDLAVIVRSDVNDDKLLNELLTPEIYRPNKLRSCMNKFKLAIDSIDARLQSLPANANDNNIELGVVQMEEFEGAIENLQKILSTAWDIYIVLNQYQCSSLMLARYYQLMIRGCLFLEVQLDTLVLSLKSESAPIWRVPSLDTIIVRLHSDMKRLVAFRDERAEVEKRKKRPPRRDDDSYSTDDSSDDSEDEPHISKPIGFALDDIPCKEVETEIAPLPVVAPTPMDIDDGMRNNKALEDEEMPEFTIESPVLIAPSAPLPPRSEPTSNSNRKRRLPRRVMNPGTPENRKWTEHIAVSENVAVPPMFDSFVSPPRTARLNLKIRNSGQYLYPADRISHNSFANAYSDLVRSFGEKTTRFVHIESDFDMRISSMIWAMQEHPSLPGSYNLYPRWFYNSYSNWAYPFNVGPRPRTGEDETYRIEIEPYRHFILAKTRATDEWEIVDFFKDFTQQGNSYRSRGLVMHHGTGLATTQKAAYWTFRQFKAAFMKTEKSSTGKQTKGRTTGRMMDSDRRERKRSGQRRKKAAKSLNQEPEVLHNGTFNASNFPFTLKMKRNGFGFAVDESDPAAKRQELIFGNIARIRFVPRKLLAADEKPDKSEETQSSNGDDFSACPTPRLFETANDLRNISHDPFDEYDIVYYTRYTFPDCIQWMADIVDNEKKVVLLYQAGERGDTATKKTWQFFAQYTNDELPSDRVRCGKRSARSADVGITETSSSSSSVPLFNSPSIDDETIKAPEPASAPIASPAPSPAPVWSTTYDDDSSDSSDSSEEEGGNDKD